MAVQIALDTNILAYAESMNDLDREKKTRSILLKLDFSKVSIPAQALGELYRVLIPKGARTPEQARERVLVWQNSVRSLPTSQAAFRAAIDLATDHNLQIWDAVILAVAAENECKCLLSEDMQDGFIWRGVEITNPLTTRGLQRLNDVLKVV